ncbi:MAG TPA: hypothetical protein VEN81_10735, partial [Planctomycetota bacterium]|nr:hypothetical protein [Planctomycetota bacterium]
MTETAQRLRPASVLFALVLLSPLLFVPGYGFDGPRVPVVLGLVALLLGLGARSGAGTGRSGILWAAVALAAAHVLSLAVAPTPGEAVTGLLVLGAGLGVFLAVRSGRVAREFACSAVPVILSIVGLGVSAIGIVQRIYGHPAVSTEGNTNYAG